MPGGTNNCDVKGSRIRSVCARCKKIRYVAVSTVVRKKAVRCRCGKTTYYVINHRGYLRESMSGTAELALDNLTKFKVFICDISPVGIGFILRSGGRMVLTENKNATIKYRSSSGSIIVRKIRIQNIYGTKVGAKFIDSLAQFAQ